ncbi:hypothetical protein GJ496_006921 [Pomphorhynchus laevis]|nr:hypothetical protein GJ496_006921 [Pomphorhynchus laevis]
MWCCKSLSKLDMSFNKIEEFSKLYDILLNTKLQFLNLSFNNIEYLKYVNEDTWRILSQSILEVLDLSNNKLSRLSIRWVMTPSLRVLNSLRILQCSSFVWKWKPIVYIKSRE